MPTSLPRMQPDPDEVAIGLRIANVIHAAVFGPKGGKQ